VRPAGALRERRVRRPASGLSPGERRCDRLVMTAAWSPERLRGRTRLEPGPKRNAPDTVTATTKVESSHFHAMSTKFRTFTQRLFQ
jgi:hypothetical protein